MTRGSNPSSPNPYLPFDPTGALFLPLALVSLVYGRKRRKSKWDILVIVTLLSLSAGMGVAACGSAPPAGQVTVTAIAVPGVPVTYTAIFADGTTVTGTLPPSAGAPSQVLGIPCQTLETLTPTPAEGGPFKRADLTQWLMDELNADKDSWIIRLVKTYIDMSPINQGAPPYPPSQGSGSFDPALYGYLLFGDAVRPGGLWDFKLEIERIVGQNIRISDAWYSYDVPGNIAFGYLGLAAGISERDLHCGADWATDWDNDSSIWGYCSGSDSPGDYNAIEAGFDLWKMTNGGPITLPILSSVLQKHALSKGRPALPKEESIEYWPYKVGTFDGESVFARR